jgi:hypothetical protein
VARTQELLPWRYQLRTSFRANPHTSHVRTSYDLRLPLIFPEMYIKWYIGLFSQALHLYISPSFLPAILTIGCLPFSICNSGLATNVGLQYPEAAATWARDIKQSMTARCLETTTSAWHSEISDWKRRNARSAAALRVSLCCSRSLVLYKSVQYTDRTQGYRAHIFRISGV